MFAHAKAEVFALEGVFFPRRLNFYRVRVELEICRTPIEALISAELFAGR